MSEAQGQSRPFVTEFGTLRALQFDGLTVQSVMSIADPDVLALMASMNQVMARWLNAGA